MQDIHGFEGFLCLPYRSHGSRLWNGSDEPVSIRQLAEEIIRRVDPKITIEFLPYRDAYGDDFEDVRRRVPDVSRLAATLGRKPSMRLGEILDDIILWKRSQRDAGVDSSSSVGG